MGNNQRKKWSLNDRLKSFSFAFSGLKTLWKEEHNFRIHFLAAFVVIVAGFIFKISAFEWVSVILSIGFVFSAEIINTSIENLSDFVSPSKNNRIKKVKDISAAGVLIAAIAALIVGLVIFLPKILQRTGI